MNTRFVRTLLVWASLVLTTGCASGPTPVNCEGRLEPINAPAPKAAPRRAGGHLTRETGAAAAPSHP